MMKLSNFIGVTTIGLMLTACMNVQVTPSGVSVNANDIDVNKSYKEGKACSHTFLGFIGPFGSMDIQKAAQAGGITKIKMVNYEAKMYVVYGELCTVVKGE